MTSNDRDSQIYDIIATAMSVHSELRHGFLESVYQEAMALEFSLKGIPFRKEVALPVEYKRLVF